MIEPELALYALDRGLEILHRHDASTVYEDVNLLDASVNRGRSATDGGLVREVQLDKGYLDATVSLPDLLENRGDFGLGATGQDDLRWAGVSERDGGGGAKATFTSAGDDD